MNKVLTNLLSVCTLTFPSRLRYCTISVTHLAGRHGFVIHPRQAWRTIALFASLNASRTRVITTDKAELLDAGLSDDDADARRTSFHYGQPGSTRHYGFDTEFSLMFFDEDMLFQASPSMPRQRFWNGGSSSLLPVDASDGRSLRASPVRGPEELILLFASSVIG